MNLFDDLNISPQSRSITEKLLSLPEFKSWFGQSKVVDEKGFPLVSYHFTKEDFDPEDFNGYSHLGTNKAAEFRFLDLQKPVLKDLLDKQIIDTSGARVVRINDILSCIPTCQDVSINRGYLF